jgi:hypothetical protein
MCVTFLLLAFFVSGCKREEIRVYKAPKDRPRTQMVEKAPATELTNSEPFKIVTVMVHHPEGSWFYKLSGDLATVDEQKPVFLEFLKSVRVTEKKPQPELAWKLPVGWKETGPGQLSVANFLIDNGPSKQAGVSITQLANLTGKDTEVINMFRAQVGLEPLTQEQVTNGMQIAEVGGEKGVLFELSNQEGGKTVASASHTSSSGSEFNWKVPEKWKSIPPKPMQQARFAVSQSGAQAEISVSIFPSDTGGTLLNVNRWRNQIQLKPISESDLKSMISPLDPGNPQSILVDMTNDQKRLIGAIVPRSGQFWFYKLLGDSEAVAPEKESFIAFAKSQP